MTPAVVDQTIQRGAAAHLWFKPKDNVSAPEAMDLGGSTFALTIIDITGGQLLTKAIGTPTDGIIRFDLTAEETATLPAGFASRYYVARLIDDVTEIWIEGSIDAKGII